MTSFGSRTSGSLRSSRYVRTVAMMLAAVTLVSLVLPLVQAPGAQADADYEREITYYLSEEEHQKAERGQDAVSETKTYYGIATSEYDPTEWANWDLTRVYFSNSFSLELDVPKNSWDGSSTVHHLSFSLDDRITITKILSSDESILKPSESNGEWSLEWNQSGSKTVKLTITISFNGVGVFTGWVDETGKSVYPGDVIDDSVSSLYATWELPYIYLDGDDFKLGDGDEKWSINCYRDYKDTSPKPFNGNTVSTADPMYMNIYHVKDGAFIDGSLPSGTYRGANGSDTSVTFGKVTLTGDVIIDNMSIKGSDPIGNHGDGANSGIFAYGHTLIMGTGLTSSVSSANTALQVFGGGSGTTIDDNTKVIIHSGVYYNVVAGGNGGTINGDTCLVMRGGTVLDTIIGGNSGGKSSTIEGSTHVYIVGGCLTADTYEEDAMGLNNIPNNIYLNESTILTGGSNNGTIGGSTNVFISGEADLWDVQGGGRRGQSQVTGTANVEVSGKAIIRHVLCGSITDGLNGIDGNGSSSGNKECVGGVSIKVTDDAKVGSVYGAGYDTYYEAKYASMINGSDIYIDISGGTVGYVYGGGYRGSVGADQSGNNVSRIGDISISISGGTILKDVFGGGRGGVDKLVHDTNSSSSKLDSTGSSKVYAESITITISGGEIGGSVYGGGESVPVLNGYNNNNINIKDGVASVDLSGDLIIQVEGGHIVGDIYGAGKGIDSSNLSSLEKPGIFYIGQDSEDKWAIERIPWYSNSDSSLYYNNSLGYSEFASVTAKSIQVSFDGYMTGVPDSADRSGSVYGGGMQGKATVSYISVKLTDSTIADNVYGGGMNGVVIGATSVNVGAGSSVYDDVYGGGMNASVGITSGYTATVEIHGNVGGNVFGGGQNGEVTGITSVTTYEGSSVHGSVYGGGQNAAVGKESSSTVNVDIGGDVGGNVFGGGQSGTVPDSTKVTIRGTSTVTGSVYGGGEKASIGAGTVVTIGGEVGKNVFGGGMEGNVPGSTSVDIVTGSVVNGSVYGGGELAGVGGSTSVIIGGFVNTDVYGGCYGLTDDPTRASVGGSTLVTITGSVGNNVFGGGKNGTVTGIPHVITEAGSVVGTDSDGGNVYGGGENAAVGTSLDSLEVIVKGGVKGNVFGGGQNGAVPKDTSVTIAETSTVTGSVYGGGEMAEVGGNTSVTIGGTVNEDVYGGGYGINGDSSKAIIGGNTSVTLLGTVHNNVYGGGQFGYVTGSTTVISEEGSVVGGSVYGGGAGSASNVDMAYVGQTTTVRIAGKVTKNVFGGGSSARVNSGTSVNITGTVNGSVYGGGEGIVGNNDIASVSGGTSVNITGTVSGSVYGGGMIGSVGGGTSVILLNSTVDGSVHGGGQGGTTPGSAMVSGSTQVDIRSSTVSGDVYGGGRGESKEPTTASVADSVELQIMDSRVDGNVFGGGMYGAIGPVDGNTVPTGTITVNVTGTSTVVGGNIHAGGLGEVDSISTNVYSRTITINGPDIGGSVYGGSRFGNDNVLVTTDEGGSKSYNVTGSSSSAVYIISGNLLYGSSGNVYGAGYRGYAGMDTSVYIGTATNGSPVSDELRLNSVYGGPSVGSSDSTGAGVVLMYGDANVLIGGSSGSDHYREVRVAGDVFGSGDYCEIDGHSYILFDAFDQGESKLQSIQKADEVRIESSNINIIGNLDGSDTGGSPRLAMNRIGELVIDKVNGTPTSLTMDAATSQISSYISMYSDGDIPGPDSQPSAFNSIRMNGGMIFSVLGKNNQGLEMGEVSGVTLFGSDANAYYGAFVIAGRTHLDASNTKFYVQVDSGDGTASGLVQADHSDFSYSFTGNSNCQVRAWFIQGAYSVEGTGIVQEGENSNRTTVSVSIPKIRTGSNIWFVGYYVNADSPGSLNIVAENGDVSNGNINVAVKMGAGSDDTLQFNNGAGIDLYTQGQTALKSTNGGKGSVLLPFDIMIKNTGFPRSGFIGTITVHLAEESGGIMTDVFDVVIYLYLRVEVPESGEVNLDNDVVMLPEGNEYIGELEVYLPVLDNNATGAYHITDVVLPDETSISITTVSSNLTKSGWFDSRYDHDPYEVNKTGTVDVLLGYGGVYSPVIRIDVNSSLAEIDGKEVIIHLEVRDENTDQITYYRITTNISLVTAPTVEVEIWDYYLNIVNGEIVSTSPWTESQIVLTLEMLYSENLSSVFVAYKGEWYTIGSMADYYKSVNDSLVKVTGSDNIQTGTEAVMTDAYKKDGYTISTVADFLKKFMESKPSSVFNDGVFDYGDNGAAWYDGESRYSEFNMDSEVTNDVSIYGGYSIVISIMVNMPEGDHNHVTVNPSQLFPGAPGTIFNLDDVRISLSDGYHIDGWEDSNGDEITNTNAFYTYSSTTIYAFVKKTQYTVNVVFQDEDGNPVENSVAKTSQYVFDQGEVVVEPSYPTDYHIQSVYGELIAGGDVIVSVGTMDGKEVLTFDSVAGDVTITVTLSDTYYVTVVMPEGSSDNDSFGLSYDSGSGTISIVSNGENSIVLPVSGKTSFTIKGGMYAEGTRSNEAVVSLWDGSDWKGLYQKSIDVEYTSVGMNEDITLYLYASIVWNLSVPTDPGYVFTIIHYDPLGNKIDVSTGLHTDDMIKLTCENGHGFSSTFTAHGVTGGGLDAVERTYKVVGFYSVDDLHFGVEFGSATIQILTVTFTVYFGDNPVNEPVWTLTVDGAVAKLTSQPNGEGSWKYTMSMEPHIYTFAMNFGGIYQDVTLSNITVSSTNCGFDIYAVPVIHGEGVPEEPVTVDQAHAVTTVGSVSGDHTVVGIEDTYKDETKVIEGLGEFTLSGETLRVELNNDVSESLLVGTILLDFADGRLLVAFTIVPTVHGAGPGEVVIS